MYLRRDERTRTVRTPAKLNVFLEVFGRRADGFHELESLIVPIRLWDSLSIESTPPDRDGQPAPIVLTVRSCLPARMPILPHDLPPSGDGNLVVRALELLRLRSGCPFGARIQLTKRIPLAAGLGGGSSDAAAALRTADHVWNLGWQRDRLAEIAAEVGSDVPFFLYGRTAICRGRGEQVTPLEPVAPLHFVVVKPPIGLSAADVYRAHAALATGAPHPMRGQLDTLLPMWRRGRLSELARRLTNRLQTAAAALTPWIDRVSSALGQLDCLAHQLSGSGSAYFGICRHAQHAKRVAAQLRTQQLGLVYVTRSC